MTIEVHKLGGSCIRSFDTLNLSIDQILKDKASTLVIVTSAPFGVTNLILEGLHNLSRILDLPYVLLPIFQNLLPDQLSQPKKFTELFNEFITRCNGISEKNQISEDLEIEMMTFGERLICPILEHFFRAIHNLRSTIVQADELLSVFGPRKDSEINFQDSQKLVEAKSDIFAEYDIIIVPGFYGIGEDRTVNLLGRSGTDYSATGLAYLLNAQAVVIWKDVLGFMSGDPGIFKDAIPLNEITYREADLLAQLGTSILHPKALNPLLDGNIPTYIRNIFDATQQTLITSHPQTQMRFSAISLFNSGNTDLKSNNSSNLGIQYFQPHQNYVLTNSQENLVSMGSIVLVGRNIVMFLQQTNKAENIFNHSEIKQYVITKDTIILHVDVTKLHSVATSLHTLLLLQ